MAENQLQSDAEQVRHLLQRWAAATRAGQHDIILQGHHPDVLIFDVLAPMLYEGADAYRASWDAWQPQTEGGTIFELRDLGVAAGTDVAFASCLIRCGGRLAGGRRFEDLVRATFCLQKMEGKWLVMHQHVSKPINREGATR